jgi:hypothetical protein
MWRQDDQKFESSPDEVSEGISQNKNKQTKRAAKA